MEIKRFVPLVVSVLASILITALLIIFFLPYQHGESQIWPGARYLVDGEVIPQPLAVTVNVVEEDQSAGKFSVRLADHFYQVEFGFVVSEAASQRKMLVMYVNEMPARVDEPVKSGPRQHDDSQDRSLLQVRK